ncbi:MAG: glycosyltransferase family 9 protein [Crocinitomicaceae bacterium]|nr:glycosyltransferase family 9 protein [Crocinitomicaceae bacterium]
MNFDEIKFDCRNFRTGIPCVPNKLNNEVCNTCTSYDPVKFRVLIIKLGALGDVIRTTPLLEKFRNEYEGVHFTWVTQSPAILPKDKVDDILAWNETSIFTISNSTFDVAINLDKEAEACILLDKVKAEKKFGFVWKDGHISPATKKAEHKILTGLFDQLSKDNTKSYLEEIFEICDYEFQGEDYDINLNTELSDKWKLHFDKLSKGREVVGLNTGCGPRWNTRLWSESAWCELAEKLIGNGYFPVFLGGQLEHEKNTRMAKSSGCHYPGHFSLEEFISLTNACDVIVTQVSMMMHIATALKKKMVLCNTIFNKHEFELYGRGVIIEPESGCECYYGGTCVRGRACMHDITPEQLSSAVVSLV